MNSVDERTPDIDLPKPKLLESTKAYGKRAAEAALEAVKPEMLANRAKASELTQARQEVKAAQEAGQSIQRAVQPLLTSLRTLNLDNQRTLWAMVRAGTAKLREQQQKPPERAQQRRQEPQKGVER